ncbi:MAG: hypothetical protein JWM43_1778 [Acidobacteriaceae bacterium]|nr:hypothetical protein [Acidobacteriaceae bacterium]
MGVDPKSGSPGWEEKLHDAGAKVEDELKAELKKVIAYINDEVVPEVRKNGSEALRAAAAQMEKLAKKMDERRAGTGSSKDGVK